MDRANYWCSSVAVTVSMSSWPRWLHHKAADLPAHATQVAHAPA
ncbi:hypothetical protein [Streptomyces mobaraensis]|nr:hypothetical protein [Streptomyces mobaraensis]